MTDPQKPLPHVQPFVERKTQPPRKNRVDTRGLLSIVTMFVSLAALTLSMLGAAKFVFDIFDDGLSNSLDGLPIKVIVLGVIFFFGWGIGLVSIRFFGNLVYPMIIKTYSWACLVAVGILYIKVIQKLYMQKYDLTHFWAYLAMLLGGLFVLICLHLLVEDHDLRPFAIPLLIISVIQLFTITIRYVFIANPNGLMLFGDFTIFGVMISISALMLMHIGILSPLRDQINSLFTHNRTPGKNGNSAG
ncbi:MAG: hypothetical protein KAY64_01735 [Anaerolineales bacterium]|nr:hypothetical protein [Anaerolineales bacterium]